MRADRLVAKGPIRLPSSATWRGAHGDSDRSTLRPCPRHGVGLRPTPTMLAREDRLPVARVSGPGSAKAAARPPLGSDDAEQPDEPDGHDEEGRAYDCDSRPDLERPKADRSFAKRDRAGEQQDETDHDADPDQRPEPHGRSPITHGVIVGARCSW